VFQALGYIEDASGEFEAIIAEGARVYLVKQGQVFADQYRAVSVDPAMVLAVRASPESVEDQLAGRTEFGAEFAFKQADVSLCSPKGRMADLSASREACMLGSCGLREQGMDFLTSFELAGFNSGLCMLVATR
jgi:hypothetical protein